MRDGTKEVLALRPGYRESVESWSEVLRDLKARGIEAPRLLMADGNAAIWGAVRQIWPEAGEQRCWNHKMRNVLDRLPQREQGEAKDLLRAVVYAPSRAEALKAREAFARRYRPWYPKAVDVLEDDWERMVAFYDFPEDHWKHLRTTNVVESPFAAVRLRTTAAKRFKRVESATALSLGYFCPLFPAMVQMLTVPGLCAPWGSETGLALGRTVGGIVAAGENDNPGRFKSRTVFRGYRDRSAFGRRARAVA